MEREREWKGRVKGHMRREFEWAGGGIEINEAKQKE